MAQRELTQAEKDSLWDEMDAHTAYLKGESENGLSYDDSIFFTNFNFFGLS